MSKPINVFDKYKQVKKGTHAEYDAVAEARVVAALRFRKKFFIGLAVAVVLGFGVFALVNFASFLQVATVVGFLLGGLGGGLVIWKIGDKAIDHFYVLSLAKQNGVIEDE